ncbi:MAG TPA: CoA-binding protein, partial [Actinobacteria bacterium]|nr:CoA-binding protein [Actinomycetota bacterium]
MLNRLLEPKSIAVIGAAREEGKVGHVILDNLIEAGFKGDIYPINPKADEIHGLKTYPSVSAVKGDIDLVIIVTPAKTVETLIEEGGKKGVKNIVVISAGFKEIGIEGARLERQIVKTAKKHGIRLLGPNCLGVINAHIGLNASFTRVGPLKGNIAFISQSGALQTAVLDMSQELGLGFSKFISLGNKADLDEVDFIQALAADKKTSVICLYLEGVSDGSKFLRVASKIALKKPIIALKAGRTAAGAKAVSSHTGTLAGSEKAYIAAFAQSGVINAASLEQLFSFAKVLSKQRTPKGNKLGIVTNAGGPAILASDFAAKAVLRIESLSGSTINNLAKFLPSAANLYNPVDLLGDAKADRYEKALKIVFSDENVDSVLVILTPQAMTEIDKTAQIVAKAAKNSKKPIVCAFMGGPEIKKAQDILQLNHIPNFIYPEEAVKAIGSLVTYSKIKTRPKARYISYAVNK